MITTEQVKELREMTGVSIMQCKKALEEAGGDMEKAQVILRKQSGAIAAKKSDRTLGAGVVESYIHATKKVGAMVILSCETDFVAKNEEFITLAREIAMQVAATNPKFVSRSEVTPEDTKAAEAVFMEEAKDKPEDMRAKIVEGKLTSFLKETILLEQDFIKDPSLTINGLIQSGTQKFGEKIEISRFVRFSL
jgi:elongation factor Ts